MLLICINELKEEVEDVNEKLSELTPEELEQVTGGEAPSILTKLGIKGLGGGKWSPVFQLSAPLYENRASEIKGEHENVKR